MAELGRLLIYEAARDWLPTIKTQVETPLVLTDATVVDMTRPVLVRSPSTATLVLQPPGLPTKPPS